jgi:quinol monooxygenase YgiN
MHALTGYLDFRPEERGQTVDAIRAVTERSRRDPGCVDYWWAEDLDRPCRFRFFECWESEEAFHSHQAKPHEHEFMADHVSRIVGADAHVMTVADRSSVMGS